LITYDDSLRSWWHAQATLILPSTRSSWARRAQREQQLSSLASSIRLGLGRYNGKEGAEAFFTDLIRGFGAKGPLALMQLCGLFAMLGSGDQPTELIAKTLAELESQGSVPFFGVELPIFLSEDRGLVEMPTFLAPRRLQNEGPFEEQSGFDFVFLRPLSKVPTREKPLGIAIYARFFASGAVASGFAHAALTPIDMVKTRLQTQPEKYKGPLSAASTIAAEEGVGAFTQGLGPTAVGYFLAGAIAFGGTEYLKRSSVRVFGTEVVLAHPFPVMLLCGAIAVAVCCVVVAPFEATRIRLVGDPDYAPSMPCAMVRIAREEGGLWTGLPLLMAKDIPFHATKFAVFDTISNALKSAPLFAETLPPAVSGAALSIASGMVAGFAAAVISQPADATFTRCNKGDDAGRMLSPPVAFADLLEKGGFGSGLSSRCVFGAILVALQFSCYDALKSVFEVSSGDLTLFLDALSGLASQGG
jgi:solute carrier family 25 phosphate transporter 3